MLRRFFCFSFIVLFSLFNLSTSFAQDSFTSFEGSFGSSPTVSDQQEAEPEAVVEEETSSSEDVSDAQETVVDSGKADSVKNDEVEKNEEKEQSAEIANKGEEKASKKGGFLSQAKFPVSKVLRKRVDFWKKVYTEVESKEGLLHDRDDLSIIYKKVTLSGNRWRRRRQIKQHKREIKNTLNSIRKKNFKNLNEQEAELLAKLPANLSAKELRSLSKNIRYQKGQRGAFRSGLIRSGKYIDQIKELFQASEVPIELAYLPHVESSFNYKAYSKVGAAGIWQFTRGTGRLFMKINYIIDERRDPIIATKSAIKLLASNYKKLGTWPFAITAYNHGPNSIRHISEKLDTDDMDVVIEKYKNRRFGFASKNFYASFIAAAETAHEYQNFFGPLKLQKPFRYDTLELTKKYNVNQVRKALELPVKTLLKYNPAIRKSAINSYLPLPANFVLKVPQKNDGQLRLMQAKLNNLKPFTMASVKDAIKHKVSYGENLYTIAKVYGTKMSNIIAYNELRNPHRIRPGLVLNIPNPLYKPKSTYTLKKPIKQKLDNKIQQKLENSLDEYKLEIYPQRRDLHLITIEVNESIGMYAEWIGTRARDIRRLNGLRYRQAIKLGSKLLLKIPEDKLKDFYIQRTNYHIGIQEDFYDSYTVVETIKYKVKRGDNFHKIMNRFELPMWLVRKYQPNGNITSLRRGQTITIPMVESLEGQQDPEETSISGQTTKIVPNS